jgi:hypothetical protein
MSLRTVAKRFPEIGVKTQPYVVRKILPVNPRLQKLALDWKTYVALVAAAATAMSAFTDMVSKAADTVSGLKSLSPEARWFVAGVFLVLTVVFLLSALSRRSLLLDPDRFLLSSDNPEHLIGREEEVVNLAQQCGRHALVFLDGDSGTGKSSLVRAGLAHRLLAQDSALARQDFVPLVVDLSSVGWQRGLSLALARGLGKLLEDAWQALGGGDRPGAEAVFRWLRARPAHAPRRLLIILDQFDDYLAVHRQQFYSGTTVRRPQEIEELSTDWHSLAKLLRSGSVTVIVVARSEAAGSFPALYFVENASIAYERVRRLPGNLVAPLLNRLTEPLAGQPVISDPEFGWLQLRLRLLRDLEAAGDGEILPIQLAVALNSLRLSRYLTPAEYERQGGLRGLERLHVKRRADKAAEAARVPTGAVLEALLTMVSPDGSKTRPVSRADFDGVLGRYGATPEAAERVILQIEDDRLLRRVLGDGVGTEALLLYHDYLARGVREAYRQVNRWTELLRERAQLFQEAVGWRQRRRALLPPGTQFRLLLARLRGKLLYGEHRGFAALSTLRFVANVWVITAGLGFLAWQINAFREQTRDLFMSGSLSTIHSMPERVRRAVLDEAFRSESAAETFLRRSKDEDLLLAITGLDPDRSDRLLGDALRRHCSAEELNRPKIDDVCGELFKAVAPDPDDAEIVLTTARSWDGKDLWSSYQQEPTRPLTSEHRRQAALIALEDLKNRNDFPNINTLAARRVAQLGGSLSAKEISDTAELIATRLRDSSDPDQTLYVCEALAHLGPWLPPWVAEEASLRLLELLRQRESIRLSRDLEGLVAKAPERVVRAIWDELVSIELDTQSDVSAAESLLPAVAHRLSPEAAAKAWREIDLMLAGEHKAEAYHLDELLEGRRQLAEKLSPEEARRSFDLLWPALLKGRTRISYDLILSSLLDLLGQLGPEREATLRTRLASWIEKDLAAADKLHLARLLQRFGPDLPAPVVQRVVQTLRGNLKSATEPGEVQGLVQALALFGEAVPRKAAEEVTQRVLDLLEDEPSSSRFAELASALEPIAPRLSPTIASDAVSYLVPYYEYKRTPELLATIARLGPDLFVPERRRLLELLRTSSQCREAAPLFNRDDLAVLAEWAQSFTCSREDRALFLKRAGELTGKSFGHVDQEGGFQPDNRAFARWAAEQRVSSSR